MNRIAQTLGTLILTGFICALVPFSGASADQSSDMSEMKEGSSNGDTKDKPMNTETATMAKGTGTVTAIDKAAGKITLDHGPIAEAGWPAMKMAFKAAPELLNGVAVGDQVAFDLKLLGGKGEVVSLRKQ